MVSEVWKTAGLIAAAVGVVQTVALVWALLRYRHVVGVLQSLLEARHRMRSVRVARADEAVQAGQYVVATDLGGVRPAQVTIAESGRATCRCRSCGHQWVTGFGDELVAKCPRCFYEHPLPTITVVPPVGS